MDECKKQYQRIIYGSTYERFFGKKVVKETDHEMLKFKDFSKVKMNYTILNKQALNTIQNWTKLADDESYVNQVITVLRSIYAYIKG